MRHARMSIAILLALAASCSSQRALRDDARELPFHVAIIPFAPTADPNESTPSGSGGMEIDLSKTNPAQKLEIMSLARYTSPIPPAPRRPKIS